jgi:hypothetical protein
MNSGARQTAFFPNKKPVDLDIKDSEVYEIANPANKRPVKQVAAAFWSVDPAIAHPPMNVDSLA